MSGPTDEQKVAQVIEHLVADGYDRDTVENGMGYQELLEIWNADHDVPPATARDTDVSPWLWEAGGG